MSDELLANSRKLFVIGDSFSVSTQPKDPALIWTRVAAASLADLLDEPVVLVNRSMMGVSQDWCWMILQDWFDSGMITDRDYLIIALTHPGRFWYLDRDPAMSNVNIIDLDRHCSREEIKAIEYFVKYIQRPGLDTINLKNRLGWLSYQTIKRQLPKPLLIKCFEQHILDQNEANELLISNGSLFEDVQYWEFHDPTSEENNNYWQGFDCRYNHMCLTNHQILGRQVAESLYHQKTLDLDKISFHRGLLEPGSLDDVEFCNRELDINALKYRSENMSKEYYKPVLPWLKRAGIKHGTHSLRSK